MVREGEKAPEFELKGSQGSEITTFTLSDLLDTGPALLSFYIYDFSPVCTRQVCEMSELEVLTFEEDISVAGISTDGPYSHREFARQKGLSYPLLTDEFGTVHDEYGLIKSETDKERHRGIVVVDEDRVVRHKWVADDKWDDWEPERLYEAIETVETLAASE